MTPDAKPEPVLKPCPFCGHDSESDTMQGFRRIGDGRLANAVAIYCTECTTQMQMYHEENPQLSPEDMLEMLTVDWNTRTTDAEIKRLRAALDFIATHGGSTPTSELPISCNGSWCAEQARRALEGEGK